MQNTAVFAFFNAASQMQNEKWKIECIFLFSFMILLQLQLSPPLNKWDGPALTNQSTAYKQVSRVLGVYWVNASSRVFYLLHLSRKTAEDNK